MPDVLAAIPFDSIVPKLRAVALVKTIRLVKVRRILKKYNEMSIGPFLKVFSILFFWVLCAHWMACGFFVIGWATCGYHIGDGHTNVSEVDCSIRGSSCEGNWITTYWPIMSDTCGTPQDGADVAGLSLGSMYIRSLAWALSTMSSNGRSRWPSCAVYTAPRTLDLHYPVLCSQIQRLNPVCDIERYLRLLLPR